MINLKKSLVIISASVLLIGLAWGGSTVYNDYKEAEKIATAKLVGIYMADFFFKVHPEYGNERDYFEEITKEKHGSTITEFFKMCGADLATNVKTDDLSSVQEQISKYMTLSNPKLKGKSLVYYKEYSGCALARTNGELVYFEREDGKKDKKPSSPVVESSDSSDKRITVQACKNKFVNDMAKNGANLTNAVDLMAQRVCDSPSHTNQITQIFTEKFYLNRENSSALGIPFVDSYKKPQCSGHDKTTSVPCTVIINNERRGVSVFREETIWVGYQRDRFPELVNKINENYKLNYIISNGFTSKICFDNCRVVIDNAGDVSTISYHSDTKAEKIRQADISKIRREELREMAINNSKVNIGQGGSTVYKDYKKPENIATAQVTPTTTHTTKLKKKIDNLEANEKLLFSCKIQKNGKLLDVYESKDTISYSYGKPNKKPELSLLVSRNKVSTYQWNGMGRYMNYSINIPNGDTIYSVFWGVDKLNQTGKIEAGVAVEIKGKEVARLLCVNRTVKQSLEGVDLKLVSY